MGHRTYSDDLRSRVVAEVAQGTSRRQAARRYRVSASSAVRWVERHEATGSVSAPAGIGDQGSGLRAQGSGIRQLDS
jgi:transposase